MYNSGRNIELRQDYSVFIYLLEIDQLIYLRSFLLLDWLLFKLLISSILKHILLQLLGVILVVRRIWSYSDANLRLISNKFIFY